MWAFIGLSLILFSVSVQCLFVSTSRHQKLLVMPQTNPIPHVSQPNSPKWLVGEKGIGCSMP